MLVLEPRVNRIVPRVRRLRGARSLRASVATAPRFPLACRCLDELFVYYAVVIVLYIFWIKIFAGLQICSFNMFFHGLGFRENNVSIFHLDVLEGGSVLI